MDTCPQNSRGRELNEVEGDRLQDNQLRAGLREGFIKMGSGATFDYRFAAGRPPTKALGLRP